MGFTPAVELFLNTPDRPALHTRPFFPESLCEHIVLIILDGTSHSVLQSAHVPCIQEMQRKGASYSTCLASFPTITGPSHTTMNTGCYPERHGVGLPTAFNNGHTGPADKSLFISAALKSAGLTTSSVADPNLKGAFSYLSVEYFGHSISKCGEMARWTFQTFKPSLLSVTFYATDSLSHLYGAGSEFTFAALEEIDAEIARIISCVDGVADLDKTLFIVTSDHGQVNTTLNVGTMLALDGEEGTDFLTRGRTVVLVDPSQEQLQRLEGSEFVQRILSPHDLRIMGHHGDPDRYVVCLREGFHWMTENLGAHGGLTQEERHVPLILSGCGVRPGQYAEIAEGVDLAPTITAVLGGEYLPSYQGRILSEAFTWDEVVTPLELVQWRRRREQWLAGADAGDAFDAAEFLQERLEIEGEYRSSVLERYSQLYPRD